MSRHGFELVHEQEIPELNTRARLFRHVKTGAELLSLENDDENKVFGITFRTPPSDSTGVAHILEHAVLAGSRKYPVKEPFLELLKSSLQTFLNAMTFPDKTAYPVASQNVQDFYNLIDVYLDGVFYPRLARHTFEQEGWHYELEDPDEPLSYKGIVFNEMKGVYASPDAVLHEAAQRSLFPDTTYGVASGGDPQHIPDLTYEQFKAFHAAYYHPSNARIFFYGDDNPEERLRIIDDYLKDFERLDVDSGVQLQPRFEAPQQIVRTYPAGQNSADGNNEMLVVNWLLEETPPPETALALHILEHILAGMPASPLRKALIESGLGEDLAGVGLDDGLRQPYFSIGLKGIAHGKVDDVESLIIRTLTDLAEHGIDPLTVQAAMNTVEFRLRENNTGHFPRGLSLMLTAFNTWLYDRDPLEQLAFEAPLQAIKAHLEAGEPYFENLIRSSFLQNQHRTTLILQPDPEQAQREEAAEEARLAETKAGMGQADLERVIENTRQLKLLQETPDAPEALAAIPSLHIDDLDKKNKVIPLEVLDRDTSKVLYHDLFTNGIVYLDVGLNLHTLPQELLPYVSLFGRALLEMGAGDEDFVQLSQRIGAKTGGIHPQSLSTLVRGTQTGTTWLFLRGKAVAAQSDDLLAILRDVLLRPRLDNQERFRQIVLEEKASQEARLVPAGVQLVNTRLRSFFNEAEWAAEQMGGVSYLFFLRQLAKTVDEDWPSVLATLEQLKQILVNRSSMLCNITVDEANWRSFEPKLVDFLHDMPAEAAAPKQWSPSNGGGNEGMIIPAKVNYVGKAANLYKMGYQLDGSVAVITNYLDNSWLWERIRVQGGAYGGACRFDHRSGVISFLSWRDPNLLETVEVYDQTARFLGEVDLNESELTRAIIGAIGNMDAYQLPDAKGFTSMMRYLAGDTDEFRQRLRDEILSTTVDDFRAFGNVLGQLKNSGLVVVLGSATAINEANTERSGWLDTFEVLPEAGQR